MRAASKAPPADGADGSEMDHAADAGSTGAGAAAIVGFASCLSGHPPKGDDNATTDKKAQDMGRLSRNTPI
jgi:hypothetical protein